MKTKDLLMAGVEAILWFAFVYYFLNTIKNIGTVNLYINALILVVLAYLAMIACPWFRHTKGWRRLMGKV